MDRLAVRRRSVTGRAGGADPAVPQGHHRRRSAAVPVLHLLHARAPPGRRMSATAPDTSRSMVDEFLFAPQSTAPMTLVRVLWGATAALWALSLLPDVDPLLTTGKLRYPHQLGKGSWNLLDHIGWSGAPAA